MKNNKDININVYLEGLIRDHTEHTYVSNIEDDDLDNVVAALMKCDEHGWKVKCSHMGQMLFSSNVTYNNAYLKCYGVNRVEYILRKDKSKSLKDMIQSTTKDEMNERLGKKLSTKQYTLEPEKVLEGIRKSLEGPKNLDVSNGIGIGFYVSKQKAMNALNPVATSICTGINKSMQAAVEEEKQRMLEEKMTREVDDYIRRDMELTEKLMASTDELENTLSETCEILYRNGGKVLVINWLRAESILTTDREKLVNLAFLIKKYNKW